MKRRGSEVCKEGMKAGKTKERTVCEGEEDRVRQKLKERRKRMTVCV